MKWRTVSPIPIKGRARHNANGVTYTDKRTREHLQRVADSWDGDKFAADVPLVLVIIAYKPIPKTAPKSVTRLDFTAKPDVDNVAKAVMDGLSGVAYEDDKQIVATLTRKAVRTRDVAEPYIEYLLAPDEEVEIWLMTKPS